MTRVSAIIMIIYLALSLAVGFLSCCCSCLTGAFRTGDEENLQYSGYQQVRQSCLHAAHMASESSCICAVTSGPGVSSAEVAAWTADSHVTILCFAGRHTANSATEQHGAGRCYHWQPLSPAAAAQVCHVPQGWPATLDVVSNMHLVITPACFKASWRNNTGCTPLQVGCTAICAAV